MGKLKRRRCGAGVDGGAERDGTPRPFRPVAGNGACRKHAATAKGVLQSSADVFDGLVVEVGIPQVDLPAIEGCSSVGGEGDGDDRSTQ